MPNIAASFWKNTKLRSVCSLGLPEHAWASVHPEEAVAHLKVAIDKTADMGAEALSGVIFGGIGERTGIPPTEKEYDNIARALQAAAKHAKSRGIELGVEAVNRYENHLINTGKQAVDMIERVGADNVFVHLDTYHMNIEEKALPTAFSMPAITSNISTSPKATGERRAMETCRGTRFMQRSPPSASRVAWRWKALSICRRRWLTGLRSGARSPRTKPKLWATACRSCATRRGNTA